MTEMTWKILLSEETAGSSGSTGAAGGGITGSAEQKTQKAAEDASAEAKKNAPAWANIGKLVGSLAAVGGVIAFVFQMMRRSRVFSTFMDSFLTELSAMIEHPGYLGAQDTYYVGTIKGIGRIYQQTFIDTYSKVAFAKLYDRKNALVAAEMLNDRIVPFFEEHQIPLLRILTDRGTEYCGVREQHEYQLYLAIEDIDHSRTKARHPQTNGICERFHKTIQQEFYQTAFRKKIYSTLEQLQSDLDAWITQYNVERPHSGKICCGRTPMQTFFDSLDLAKNKMLDNLHSADINVAA
jgi:hypothetical protein